MCFHINSLTGEIGDSSRTPETYFDTDRHPEHEDC